MLYFHGGGFCVGAVASYRGVAGLLAHTFRRPVLAVEYRQGPEHRRPAPIEDGCAAYARLCAETADAITLIGDSAGGAIAVLTAIHAARAGLRRPRSVISTSGWFDLVMSGRTYQTHRTSTS